MTLSWWGVDSVMSGTAYDRPLALPISSDAQAVKPQAASTQRLPSPSVSPTPTPSASPTPKQTPKPKPAPTASKSSSPSTPPAKQPSSGTVKGYTVSGGRVVFDVGATSAELVSATPDAGWQMQVWKQTEWIRVTFTQDGHESSVFYTWNGHPPTVEFDER